MGRKIRHELKQLDIFSNELQCDNHNRFLINMNDDGDFEILVRN